MTSPDKGNSSDWRDKYVGVIDYPAIVLWVMESAELAAVALSASSATAAGVGAGAVGALGALALGATGPVTVAGLTAAAVGAAVVGGVAADKGMGKDAPTAADKLGQDFYKVLLQDEPFKSTTVSFDFANRLICRDQVASDNNLYSLFGLTEGYAMPVIYYLSSPLNEMESLLLFILS